MGRNRELEYEIDENECWIITSHYSSNKRQPVIMVNGKMYHAHRYLYEKHVGKIEDGFIISRVCKNMFCCNPQHMKLEKKIKNIEYKVTENGCWEITSHLSKSYGYTILREKGNNKKKILAHRYFYEKKYGEIHSEIILRHKCDNSLCVNPEHLEPGTHADNVRDRVERNRSAIGEKHGRSKITEDDVRFIRQNTTLTNTELGKMFDVNPKVIKMVKEFKTWKHVQ